MVEFFGESTIIKCVAVVGYPQADLGLAYVEEDGGSHIIRGYSSVGRAMRSQRIGQGFESPYLHCL